MSTTTARSTRWWASLAMAPLVALAACGDDSDDAEDAGAGEADVADIDEVDVETVRGEHVASPQVTGPITGGDRGLPFNPMPTHLADEYGYVEEEFFLAGEAMAYEPEGDWDEDGEWGASPTETAPYQTRILVRRPADPDAFNGTVVVEWLNVTAGMDGDFHFMLAHEELLREGYVWVGVSAQSLGIEGGEDDTPGIENGNGIPGLERLLPLKDWDSERYRDLTHPGDDFSYDIYSQAARAIRQPEGVDPLSGLAVQQVVATGFSQSSAWLTTYVNAVHPIADIYDGFLLHGRLFRAGTALTETNDSISAGAGGLFHPGVARIRTDLRDPVMQLLPESDVFGLTRALFPLIPFYEARQPDTELIRTWEVAGTAHLDQRVLDGWANSVREWDESHDPGISGCPANNGPHSPVLHAGLAALTEWAGGGNPPAQAEPLEVNEAALDLLAAQLRAVEAGETPLPRLTGDALVRDEHGNAIGGVRTPAVDVPIATHTGEDDCVQTETLFDGLVLSGSTTPFDQETLISLYPTHEDYVEAVRAATQEAVDAGFLLPVDGEQIINEAEQATIPE